VKLELWQRNLIALVFARIGMDIGMTFVLPFMPLYLKTMGVEGTAAIAQWAGTIAASYAIAMVVAQPVWGSLADRWGRKAMVIRSMLAGGVIVALTGFARSPEEILALRVLMGFLSGSVAVTNAMVAGFTPRERLGFALGITQVTQFFGTSTGPLVGGYVSDAFGFRTAFLISGALMMVGGIIVTLFVRENFSRASASSSGGGLISQSRTLLAIGTFPVVMGIVFMISLGGTIVSPILSLFIADLNGPAGAATAAGMIMAGTSVFSAISAIAIGRFSDRVGRSKILIVCLLGACIAYAPQALVQNVWQLLGLRMLLGLFLGGLMPVAMALVAELVPAERRGVAFGLTVSAQSAAQAVGPLIAAAIAANVGMRPVFLVTSVLFAVTVIATAISFRRASSGRPATEVAR
jgi:MFS transporter, DHA1 family, multidrug resistance protein